MRYIIFVAFNSLLIKETDGRACGNVGKSSARDFSKRLVEIRVLFADFHRRGIFHQATLRYTHRFL